MALFNELYAASFRGAGFLVDSHEKDGGRKIVVHEFPNKTGRYVEDLGGLLRTFKIKGVISEPDYTAKKLALETALETGGIGTLIHPFYGSVQVVPDVYTLNEDMTRLGEAVFDMTFYEAQENVFPTASPDNQSLINGLSGSALSSAQNAMGSAWGVTNGYKYNYANAQGILNNLGNSFGSVIDPFNSNPTARSKYNLQLSNYFSGINQSISNPTQVSFSVKNLFDSLNNLTTDSRQRFNTTTKFFNYGNNVLLPPPTTVKRQQLIQNNQALYSQVNMSSLASSYNSAAQINYIDENDLNSVEDMLDKQFYYCIDNSIFNENTLSVLKNLRNQVRIYFDRIRLDVRRLVPIATNQTTVTTLTFAYYNSLNNDSILVDINRIFTPNNVAGNLQIVTNQ